jgi:hypothetical protein
VAIRRGDVGPVRGRELLQTQSGACRISYKSLQSPPVVFLAHGGTAGLLVEAFPAVAIGVLWLAVWRRSRRAGGAGSAARDEAGVEEERG